MHSGAVRAVQKEKVKTCTQCKLEKRLFDDFHRHKGHADGFASRCKTCCKLNYDDKVEERRAISRASHKKHRDKRNAYSRGQFKKLLRDKPEMMLWYKAKARAKKQGTPFNITPEDLTIPQVCPVLGIPLIHGKGAQRNNSPSVDRKIPALGYVEGNVQVISWRANDLKKNGTLEEFRRLIAYLES